MKKLTRKMNERRLFFGMDIYAPWPFSWPKGRLLKKSNRHVTLAFLGSVDYEKVMAVLPTFPSPPFQIGPSGKFDSCLLLPDEKKPQVAAWHIQWFEEQILLFQKSLMSWLNEQCDLAVSSKSLLSHVTLCRKPQDPAAWLAHFKMLPCYTKKIHLFESLAGSCYRSCWSKSFLAPFQEIDHAADIAFKIYGKDPYQLYQNACLALSFRCPAFLQFMVEKKKMQTLEEIVIHLNKIVSEIDRTLGSTFKAVSFHGEIEQASSNLLRWEMIVDV